MARKNKQMQKTERWKQIQERSQGGDLMEDDLYGGGQFGVDQFDSMNAPVYGMHGPSTFPKMDAGADLHPKGTPQDKNAIMILNDKYKVIITEVFLSAFVYLKMYIEIRHCLSSIKTCLSRQTEDNIMPFSPPNLLPTVHLSSSKGIVTYSAVQTAVCIGPLYVSFSNWASHEMGALTD